MNFSDDERASRGTSWPWLLTIGWLALCALGYFGLAGGEAGLDPLRIMMIPVSVFGPLALIWFGWLLLGMQRATRAELGHLRAALDRAETGARPVAVPPTQTESRTARVETRSAPPPSRIGARTGRTAPDPRPAAEEPEPEPPAEPAPLATEDLIRALHFPADPEDKAGFRSLRLAMQHPETKPLLTAAQDVLTLLSQDGHYMDDLTPEPATTETWRGFARGRRESPLREASELQSPGAVSAVSQRLASDVIFQDAVHHFMRSFEYLLADIEPRLSDDEMNALSETRTSTAFLLVSRVLEMSPDAEDRPEDDETS